jgi:hypothetical protein
MKCPQCSSLMMWKDRNPFGNCVVWECPICHVTKTILDYSGKPEGIVM